MVSKDFVPFGGVHGWVIDLTVGRIALAAETKSYCVVEPNEGRALAAMRAHVAAIPNASITVIRSLSRQEIAGRQLKPGQIKPR